MNRILIVGSKASSLKNFRGALIQEFIKLGHEVHCVAPNLSADNETSAWLRNEGAFIHDVYMARTSVNPLRDIRLIIELLKLMHKIQPEIFLGYTIKPVIWGGLTAKIINVPKRIALITGLGYAFTGKAQGFRNYLRSLILLLYRLILHQATHVIFQNKDDQLEFRNLGLLNDSMSSSVVNGSGVNTEYFYSASFPNGPLVFLLIARLLGDKGIREYATAAKNVRRAFPDVKFHLLGGIDENPDSINQYEVENWHKSGQITWLGELKDVRPSIKAAHVFVLPSYREGTPRTVLEAMSMGRPIITTDTPGCRQTIEDGVNGFLVPVADPKSLESAMLKFIQKRTIIARMGRESRRIAEEKYHVNKVNISIINAIGLNNETRSLSKS